MQSTIIYQSPLTNNTYEAIYSEKGYKRYNIFLDGEWILFALTAEEIPLSVKHYEQPGWHGVYSSRFD